MAQFNIDAKLTQSKYGRSSKLAAFDKGYKNHINAAIESHKNPTSINAQSGRCSLKKSRLHNELHKKFSANKPIMVARLLGVSARRQASTPAVAAQANMVVHAGPNNQSGGFHDGCLRAKYHGPKFVNSPPTTAAAMATVTATIIGLRRLLPVMLRTQQYRVASS
jgi:lambda repressor-like predicted transcriptional regulator